MAAPAFEGDVGSVSYGGQAFKWPYHILIEVRQNVMVFEHLKSF